MCSSLELLSKLWRANSCFFLLSEMLVELNSVELNSVLTQAFIHICISRLYLKSAQ